MKIEKVWFDNDYVFIKTDIGHIVGNPLSWFPILQNATLQQKNNYEIGHFGIHWPDLNEDLGLSGFFEYKRDVLFPEKLAKANEILSKMKNPLPA